MLARTLSRAHRASLAGLQGRRKRPLPNNHPVYNLGSTWCYGTPRGVRTVGVEASALLGSFLAEHEERVVKRASKLLTHELDEGLSREHRRQAAPSYVGELASLLLERGLDAPRLWGEAVRHHGGAHFEARHDVSDLIREFRAVEAAVLEEWHRRVGPMPADIALLLGECVNEGAAAAVSDFIRRARGEQVQFREEALIQAILEHLDEGILLVEADGSFSLATAPAVQLLGARLLEAVGHPVTGPPMAQLLESLSATTPEGTPVRASDLPAVATLRTGERSLPMSLKVVIDGAPRVLEVTALPIFEDDEGDHASDRRLLRGAIMTLRDRTAQKAREEEFARANRELVELQSRLLHRSRVQAMGELATGAAHAFNNLLNAMHLRLRLLRERPGPEPIEALGRSVSDIASLVARLQQFAGQPPAGQVVGCDLDAALREALALVRPEGQRAAEVVHLHVDLRAPPAACANPAELREVLVWLLLDARDHLSRGGELRVQTRTDDGAPQILVSVSPKGGERLAPEAWSEPFLQAGAPASLALAAASARDALRRWGGSLEARAVASEGSQFVLSFAPLAPQAVAAASPSPAPSPGAALVRQVLVIDDDPDNATMLAEVLATEGHETDTATSGREAIAKWGAGRFDVALVDLLMPDMPGTEIAQALLAARPSARVALVTGWELDSNQERAARVHAVFRKPVDLGLLLRFLAPEPGVEHPAPPA